MSSLIEMVGHLVSAHAAKIPMTTGEILADITKVHNALNRLEPNQTVAEEPERTSHLTIKAGQLVSAHAAKVPMTTNQILTEIAKVHHALNMLEVGQPKNVSSHRDG